MAQVTIETIKNGPYIVKGEVELIDADGNKFPVEKGWRCVAAGHQRRNHFVTARIRRSASKLPKKRCRNRRNKHPQISQMNTVYSGSARAPGAGFGASPKRTFLFFAVVLFASWFSARTEKIALVGATFRRRNRCPHRQDRQRKFRRSCHSQFESAGRHRACI